MSSANSKEAVWVKITNSYKELIERYDLTYMTPFLKVIDQLAQSDYGKVLHPNTSMHSLVLASSPRYPERLHKPYVILAPKKEGVEVRLGPSLKDYDRRFFFSHAEVFEKIQPLLLSLSGYTSA